MTKPNSSELQESERFHLVKPCWIDKYRAITYWFSMPGKTATGRCLPTTI
ncbi:hypothetical protein LX87_00762 [Larkinella arboricola]|uniref:Uncharacterized protein n=1 Tax=Larkinella arboricola TaxID=643671 RepID=A0A327XAJ4_LARAB|nr:hypothetical protein [Larkinella arboricola]RAK02642.1 hypothetical protein LX87_00762 [Larkinella arboricola]